MAKGGICKVKSCQKYGSYLKRLDVHLKRIHPTLSAKMHRYLPLPPTMTGTPNHMKYRKKETCKLCQKTLLLLPHLKRCHKIYSMEDYNKLPCAKKCKSDSKVTKKKIIKENPLTPAILPHVNTENSNKMQRRLGKAWQHLKGETSLRDKHVIMGKQTTSEQYCCTGGGVLPKLKSKLKRNETSYSKKEMHSLKEMVRYFVHKMYPYQVIALGLVARKNGYKSKSTIASYMHKTCMNNIDIDDCKLAIDYLQYLCPYFRFCALFNYPKFKCICNGGSSCKPLPKDFRLYCKRTCANSMNCGCKLLDNSAHACIDFFSCKVCDRYYKSTAKESFVKL
ncbi:uncharacterized protein LOC114540137 [Dendronephthya gigantea]|uniref:uncharacterized protein LOC114531465 n=1 Tax=Dendronephthya gigantea TaxID=151771 RepID=UPI00106B05A4|nr:uncharacterized protein LOC114531465 [Dendronephthya gigantea]XP_028410584.1 uncharacterized protein LOC114533279 [Dendronephthya gigantea]XP_028410589.1 uncharacterized protein LOC114533284 [Dendronephthya gigantea]XP_028416221.1 uncharacterized protein LOC114540137 [Dendronephthya gigantea]